MAAKKYLSNLAGRIQEVIATIVSAGAANDGDLVALDSTGRLDTSVMPVGIAPEVTNAPASENLTGGNLVNVWNDSGTVRVRKADATTAGKEANGFVLAAVTSGATATVYHEGKNTGVSGLTPGARYYLSTTAGGVVSTAPTGSGNVVQFIGHTTAAGELLFEPSEGFILA